MSDCPPNSGAKEDMPVRLGWAKSGHMHLLRRRSQPAPWFARSRPRFRGLNICISAGHGASSSKFDRSLFKFSAKTPRSKRALLGADTGSQSNAD
jgi:hypothetical protein